MYGLEYPLSLSGGNLKTVSEYSIIVRNAIFSGLYTQTEERVMRPEYGLDAQEFQDSSNMVHILGSIRTSLQKALEEYDDVTFELAGSINDNGLLDVLVVYYLDDEQYKIEVSI